MRLNRFAIRHYGPLRDTGLLEPGDFSLFFAPNEEGKTLVVEALARMMLGKGVRALDGIDRVDQNPDGFAELDLEDGPKKLPEQGDLPTLCDLGAREWRSLFLVRDSDLSIGDQAAVYNSVTDRLTGLKTEEIARVTDQLRETAHLTDERLELSGAAEHDHVGRRVEKAGELASEIEELERRVRERDFDRMERDIAAAADRVAELEAHIDLLERARKRETLHRAREALSKLREARSKAEALGDLSEEELEKWRDADRDADKAQSRVEELRNEAEDREKELRALQRRVEEAERTRETLEGRLEDAEELKHRLLPDYGEAARELEAAEPVARRLRQGFLVLSVLTGLGLLALLVTGGALAGASTALLAVAVLAAGGLVLRHSRRRGGHQSLRAQLLQRAAAAGLQPAEQSAQAVRRALRDLEERCEQERQTCNDLRAALKSARNGLRELREKEIPRAEEQVEQNREIVREIRRRSGVEEREGYRARLEQKQEHLQTAQRQAAVLADRLGAADGSLEQKARQWKQGLEPLREFEGAAPGVEYSDQAAEEAQRERQSLQQRRDELRQSMDSLRQELSRVERRANEILRPEDEHLHCDTSADLAGIRDRLRRFVARHQDRAEVARRAISIFEGIGRREEEKVADLFGPDSAVSEYFARITGDDYEAVLYRQQEDGRRVVAQPRWQDAALPAQSLSGGAYDQLYLAVRLALGRDLLGGRAGFFIMDDPFVKADPERLERQMDLLREIAADGWQVLYFTAKGEVLDALRGDIDAGRVRRIDLPGLRR
ncbi:MAG: ATP-binding protein [Planctomycetota bacterium]